MNMQILVTGATGNVGSLVFDDLVAHDAPCKAAVRTPTKFKRPGQAVRLDFEDASTFGPALEGITHLFLVRPPAIADVKKVMTPFLEAAKAAGVRHVVFLSILGAEKNPFLPHRKMELDIEASGIAYTHLRAGFFMQNFSTTHLLDIRERRRIFLPAGNGRTSFVDVRDLARAASLVLTHPGHENRAYDLTGSEALDYHQIAKVFSEDLGRDIPYEPASPLAFVRELRRQGIEWTMAFVMLGIYLTCRFGLAGRLSSDLEKLLDEPPITFRKFVHDHRNLWA